MMAFHWQYLGCILLPALHEAEEGVEEALEVLRSGRVLWVELHGEERLPAGVDDALVGTAGEGIESLIPKGFVEV